jgi:hypothetical protein
MLKLIDTSPLILLTRAWYLCLWKQHHEDGSLRNETESVVKLWETVWLSFVLQQLRNNSFMWLCVTWNLTEWHLLLNYSFKLYETDFMQLVSSAYGAPKWLREPWILAAVWGKPLCLGETVLGVCGTVYWKWEQPCYRRKFGLVQGYSKYSASVPPYVI